MVPGPLLFVARLRTAPRLSRRRFRHWTLLGQQLSRPAVLCRARAVGCFLWRRLDKSRELLRTADALRELDLAPGPICLGAGQCRPALASLYRRSLGVHPALWLDVGVQ